MLLNDISKNIECKKKYNIKKANIYFQSIHSNSKAVKNPSIFVIDAKKKFKQEYVKESITRGAVALITNKYVKNFFIPQYIVKDINKTKKILLRKLFPNPPLHSVAVTGTNGKTSVVWFISQICERNKKLIKTYGTLGYYKNGKKINNSNLTTPELEILYQSAFLKKKKNLYNFVFEVSSHSLAQNRIKNFPINIAAITNISHDHLDYHKTFENYKRSKLRLFTYTLNQNGLAIINDNIKGAQTLKNKLIKKNKVISYGKENSDVNIISIKNKIEIKIFSKKYQVSLLNYSPIELENIACAICCCLGLGINIQDIIKVLHKITKPKGRLEEVGKLKNNSIIYVDYAHTPDALKTVLINKTFLKSKPSVVFGCGGERDKDKRLLMGSIANRYASKVYITDDNPRNEDPKKIRKAILSKCRRAIEIPDRKKAIKKAINDLQKNEILIIAGKGHEKKQVRKNQIKFFDDVQVAKYFIIKKI